MTPERDEARWAVDELRAPGTDDYVFGLYLPSADRPRHPLVWVLIAALSLFALGLLVALFLATF